MIKKFLCLMTIMTALLAPLRAQDPVTLFYFDISDSMTEHYAAILETAFLKHIRGRFTENQNFILRCFSDNIYSLGEVKIGKADKNQRIYDIIRKTLKQPTVGAFTDLGTLFSDIDLHLDQYTSSDKLLVVLTDGLHEPALNSPWAADKAALKTYIQGVLLNAKTLGWKTLIIRIPLLENTTGNTTTDPKVTDAFDLFSITDPDQVKLIDPEDIKNGEGRFSENQTEDLVDALSNTQVELYSKNVQEWADLFPAITDPAARIEFLNAREDSFVNPFTRAFFISMFEIPGLLFFIILFVVTVAVAIAVGLLIRRHMDDIRDFFYMISIHSSFKNLPNLRAIEMFALPQRTNMGRRNIHKIPEGKKAYIGGNGSLFLIFIAPFPRKIAELRHRDGTYSLKIIKRDFFPENDSAFIEDCLGKQIKAVPYKGQSVFLDFHEFIPQAEIANEFMRKMKYKREEPSIQGLKDREG